MVTDSLIRKKFVRDTLQQGISKIYATQESVVRSNYQLQSGRLLTSLSKHSSSSTITGESYTIFVRILPYLRFLDMVCSTMKHSHNFVSDSRTKCVKLFMINYNIH